MHFRLLAIIVVLLTPVTARAAVTIDWAGATINTINSQSATVTGLTTGDVSVGYTITINSNISQDISFAAPLGNTTPVLNLNLPAPRNAATLMTVSIALNGGLTMVNPSFALLDIDASVGNTFSSWRDQLIFTSASVSMTAVNPAFTQVTGNTALGMDGNVPNGSTSANVNVTTGGVISSMDYTYGPGLGDQFGQNQRHGISIITMDAVVPEPSTWALLSMAALFGIAHARRKGWRLLRA